MNEEERKKENLIQAQVNQDFYKQGVKDGIKQSDTYKEGAMDVIEVIRKTLKDWEKLLG